MDNTESTGEYGAADEQPVLDDLREMPVGMNDPNIVGDAGPTDVPPGTDPHDEQELTLVDEDAEPVE